MWNAMHLYIPTSLGCATWLHSTFLHTSSVVILFRCLLFSICCRITPMRTESYIKLNWGHRSTLHCTPQLVSLPFWKPQLNLLLNFYFFQYLFASFFFLIELLKFCWHTCIHYCILCIVFHVHVTGRCMQVHGFRCFCLQVVQKWIEWNKVPSLQTWWTSVIT